MRRCKLETEEYMWRFNDSILDKESTSHTRTEITGYSRSGSGKRLSKGHVWAVRPKLNVLIRDKISFVCINHLTSAGKSCSWALILYDRCSCECASMEQNPRHFHGNESVLFPFLLRFFGTFENAKTWVLIHQFYYLWIWVFMCIYIKYICIYTYIYENIYRYMYKYISIYMKIYIYISLSLSLSL